MIVLYGISNCDSIKKARRWLESKGIEYRFHDYRKDGLHEAMLEQWVDELGWEKLLNQRGTTWRNLPDHEKTALDKKGAIALMKKYPAIIKRPLLDTGSKRIQGFSEEHYSTVFS